MVRRTIVTSQPEIACDVCARRLLRGEHSEIFLASGRRCNVCELCAPRAAHEGWKREVEYDPVNHAQLRPRRGRSLLDRLRKGSRPEDSSGGGRLDERSPFEPLSPVDPEPYDFLGGSGEATPNGAGSFFDETSDERPRARPAAAVRTRTGLATPISAHLVSALQRAVDVFNGGEYPRRVAGVARSLGVPEVSVHQADPASEQVGIVIAWELCWYRYAVDIGGGGQALVLAQGTTLDELAPEERLANGAIDDRGALSLAGD
jgi:hypothetical protein